MEEIGRIGTERENLKKDNSSPGLESRFPLLLLFFCPHITEFFAIFLPSVTSSLFVIR